jgi:hypothetical protein
VVKRVRGASVRPRSRLVASALLHKCCYRSSGELLSRAFEASRVIDVSSGAVASACHLCTPREVKGFKTTVRLETSHSLARIWVLKPLKSSRSSDWDDGEDEKPRNASEPLDVRVSLPDPDPRPHLISKLFAAIQRRKREP